MKMKNIQCQTMKGISITLTVNLQILQCILLRIVIKLKKERAKESIKIILLQLLMRKTTDDLNIHL
jgi:hypothetical protein